MKAKDLVNNGTMTIEDFKNFIGGTENYEQVQQELNESTGFESTKLYLNTDDDFTSDDLLNADLIEQIAKTCHAVNKAFCEHLGDTSQPTWEEAPDWQKQSAMNGVRYHLENPDSKPSDSHNNWMSEKKADGWVYGEVKDPEKKEHPCLVEYEELPKDQQAKDSLFIAVVRSFE